MTVASELKVDTPSIPLVMVKKMVVGRIWVCVEVRCAVLVVPLAVKYDLNVDISRLVTVDTMLLVMTVGMSNGTVLTTVITEVETKVEATMVTFLVK